MQRGGFRGDHRRALAHLLVRHLLVADDVHLVARRRGVELLDDAVLPRRGRRGVEHLARVLLPHHIGSLHEKKIHKNVRGIG